jgi:fatty-acyl-CoA synthase
VHSVGDDRRVAATRRIHLSEQLSAAARKRPDHPALWRDGASLTYGELDARASRVAGALASRGVEPGDRVVLLAQNGFEWVESFFGVVRAGAIVAPLNFRLTAAELAAITGDCDPAAAIVDGELWPLLQCALSDSASLRACLVIGPPIPVGDPPAEDYCAAVAGADRVGDASLDHARDDDVAVLCFTSGTTGRPKGAMLTHANLALNVLNAAAVLGLTEPDEVWACGSPLFHVGGFGDLLMQVPICGTFVILPSRHFDAASIAHLMERSGTTGCSFVPAQWQAICGLQGIRERPLAQQLRHVGYGTSASPMVLLEALNDTFPNADRIHAFGQTEMSPTTTILHGEDAVRKLGSVGRPIPHVEARIVDDDMNDVVVGEVGEIVYRGPHVFAGYWRSPEQTADAFAGGWFHSGDLCRMDDEGYVYVVDRKKDMIISGGENIYSAEVENAIAGLLGVAQVSVVGVPHPTWGETPAAAIVPVDASHPPTPEDVITGCRDSLASYKKPTVVVVVEALPRNSSGKVIKAEVRQMILARTRH